MAIYHCSIKIIGRSGGRSAVASAAYRAGECLHNDETGITHDFSKKSGVIHTEILLPENAPAAFSDRELLWNEVQRTEKRSDAQFAREIEAALPVEMSRVEQVECIRHFIGDQFVSKGMAADWALHDKGDGNPHVHIMLTMRGFAEDGRWDKKTRTVFANTRDAEGRPVYDPELPSYDPKENRGPDGRRPSEQYRIPVLDENGEQKVRIRKGKGAEKLWERITIPANDWNDRQRAEEWRRVWAESCNRYLAPENRIDHRSYERQGIDMEPTIHEGVTARKMEAAGKEADRCQWNREIRERNQLRRQIAEAAKEITEYIKEKAGELLGRFRELGKSVGAFGKTGRDDDLTGRTSDGERTAGGREQGAAAAAAGIARIKQAAGETDQHIAQTEHAIDRTDQRISELRKQIKEKEAERNERFNRLLKRRSAFGYDGENAGRDREIRMPDQNVGRRESESEKPKRKVSRNYGMSR